MEKTSKIYVAGHRGLVGSALIRILNAEGYSNIITKTHTELDLIRQSDVEKFFAAEKPEYVFLVAAKVGGIQFHAKYPADLLYENIAIEMNVIKAACENGVKKLLFIGGTSIYPKDSPQPIQENAIMTGKLEPANEPYGLAKLIGVKLCEYFNRQYGTDFISIASTNLYGYEDNYDPNNSHVLPALIRKFADSVGVNPKNKVVIWGSGNARREFLHADDLADACVFLMNNYSGNEQVNVGSGVDITIRELAELVKRISGFSGEIVYDTTKPDGIMKRQTDCSKLFSLGWKPKITLEQGIYDVYRDYLKRKNV